jgi:hypothetical protein
MILPCGCDPEEGPSRGTRCDAAWTLYQRFKAEDGTATPGGTAWAAALHRHYDEQRRQARKERLRVRALTRRTL